MGLYVQTCKRLIIALTGRQYGQNVAGAIGLYGNAVMGASGAVASSHGDWTCSEVAAGEYQFTLTNPALNQQIYSMDWVEAQGFTPRALSVAETVAARVTGYGINNGIPYIDVQVASLSTQAVATPPTGFVIMVKASVTYQQTAYAL